MLMRGLSKDYRFGSISYTVDQKQWVVPVRGNKYVIRFRLHFDILPGLEMFIAIKMQAHAIRSRKSTLHLRPEHRGFMVKWE